MLVALPLFAFASFATMVTVNPVTYGAQLGVYTTPYFENANAPVTGCASPCLTVDTQTSVPAPTTPTLDGSAGNTFNGVSGSVSLATNKTGDVIYVVVSLKNKATVTVSDAASLTWSERGSSTNGGQLFAFYAIVSGVLSSDSITVSLTGGNQNFAVIAFGVNGADTASPFDSNLAAPATSTGNTNSPAVTVSPASSNDLLVGAVFANHGPTVSAGGCCSLISAEVSAGHVSGGAEYESGAPSGSQSINFSLSQKQNWAMVGDALTGGGFILAPGKSAYLWTPPFTSATSIQAGFLSLDVWATPTPAVDGSNINTFTGTTGSVTLTTSEPNDLIYVAVATNSNPSIAISGGGLAWNSRATAFTGNGQVETFYAVASGTLSSASITTTLGASQPAVILAFGISGANTVSPFDATAQTAVGNNNNPSVTVSPSGSNDFLIGALYLKSNPALSAGTGFTLLTSAADGNHLTGAADVMSAAPSGSQSVSFSYTGGSQQWAIIGDAVKPASATLTVSSYATDSTGAVVNTLFAGLSTALIPSTGGQVAATFSSSAATVPGGGYVEVVITAPADQSIAIGWGPGHPTNFQVVYVYSQVG